MKPKWRQLRNKTKQLQLLIGFSIRTFPDLVWVRLEADRELDEVRTFLGVESPAAWKVLDGAAADPAVSPADRVGCPPPTAVEDAPMAWSTSPELCAELNSRDLLR